MPGELDFQFPDENDTKFEAGGNIEIEIGAPAALEIEGGVVVELRRCSRGRSERGDAGVALRRAAVAVENDEFAGAWAPEWKGHCPSSQDCMQPVPPA